MPQSGKNEKISYTAPLLIGLVAIGVLIGIRWLMFTGSAPVVPKPELFTGISLPELNDQLDSLLTMQGGRIKSGGESAPGRKLLLAEIPFRTPIPAVHLAIRESLDTLNVEIASALSNPETGHLTLSLGWQDSILLDLQLRSASPPAVRSARIAVLIDDFGSAWGDREVAFTRLGIPLTISIIPGAGKSRRVSAEMAGRDCEVLLHMPMEPLNLSVKDDGYLITTGMSLPDIESRFRKAFGEVPDRVGVNNHMGSKVSSHRGTISDVLSVIKKEGLYFIDSRTIAETVAYQTAQAMGIPSGFRDIFLDADNSESEIMLQIEKLKNKARQNGSALAIGHCRQNTLRILQREIPKMKADGYTFIYVSQLIR